MQRTARLALILAGVALALALCEGTLQLLRLALGTGELVDIRANAHPGKTALLCLGDSHTYGLGVQRELQAYPVRLEVALNGGERDGPFVVENGGTPGNNCELTAWQLRRALARGHYDAVVLLAGFNDEWNVTVPAADDAAPARAKLLLPQLLRWIAFCLRPPPRATDVVERDEQGLYILAADGTRQRVNDDPTSRQGLFTGSALAKRVEAGLTSMVRTCRQAGVPVLLQTYATRMNDRFLMASAGARVVAQKEGVPLVDQAQWFDEHAQNVDARLLFQPDGHPNGAGYERMAQAIAEKLRELKGRGTAPFAGWPIAKASATAMTATGASTATAAPAVDRAKLELALEPATTKGVVRFRVRGPAGAAFRVALARARANGGDHAAIGGDSHLELAQDALFVASLNADGLAGTIGADGTARAWVGGDHFTEPKQASAFAQLLVVDPYAADAQAALRGSSAVVEVPWPLK